ncbi:MAG: M28 family peptidase, partial [Nitrospiria bacterium]
MTSDFSTEERPARERQAEIAQRIAGISETRVLQHIKRLEGAKHATTTPEALQSGADYILTQMKRIGLDPIKERIDGEGDQSFINLIGRLAGDRTGREILVVGAHYDTVAESPGADDNASGLAVLLEVARILSPMRGKLTLQFVAFSLEEEGLLGSDHYVRRVRRNKIPLWGAIVMECVGYIDRRLGSQKSPEGFPFALPERG